MKRSIRARITILFAGLMIGVILVICLANSLYLERFYISQKSRDLVSVYDEINVILKSEDLSDRSIYLEIAQLFESSNISAVVDNYLFGYENQIEEQMAALILGRGGELSQVIESGDRYAVQYWNDTNMQSSFIIFVGILDNGSICMFRSSVPAILDSVQIANRFVWIVGIGMVILGSIIVAFVSKRISDPVKELSQIADKMAHLDFSVRYQRKSRQDEIALLGFSINHMADALETTIQDLQHANQQLAADIQQKEKEEEAQRDFISDVSHELKTPIALIQGYAEGLVDGITDDPESMNYYCEVIMDEADKMNQLVKKLLTLNQIESGVNELDLVDFDLAKVIDGVIRSFNIMMQQNQITVDFDSSISIWIRADEFMMEEVVRNYISNAVNHIDGERRITIRSEQDQFSVRVSVFNTGDPIPEDSIENVWDKFYKVDKARTREYGGSGIGLSIVKAVMDAHHGSCGVYNTEDGVCFWFELNKPAWPIVREDQGIFNK